MKGGLNRRELLLAAPALIVLPRLAWATIPPPPSSPWYLIFIADGIYRISNFYVVDLPASAGTGRNYDPATVSQAFGANFTYTQRTGISAWYQLLNAPSYRWWEYYDKRNGRYIRIYRGDRIEARFADGSRVKVVFRGEGAVLRFEPLEGTERRPDGQHYTHDGEHEYREKGGGGGGVTAYTPSVTQFSWSWSSQETPW